MAAGAVPSELEVKLLAAGERELRAIAQRTRLGPYRLRARDAVRLHSVYLDTADRALAREGVALRLRRLGRRHWEVTAKWAGQVSGVLHERPELTVVLAGPPVMPFVVPVGPLHVHLAAVVAGRPLRPLLITKIHRRRIDVLAADDADDAPVLAELALDRVQLCGPDEGPARDRYCEVEVERLHGTRRDLGVLARVLRVEFALTPSADSKFARGLTLIYGPEGVARPVAATVQPQDTVAQAARKIVGVHLRRLRRYDPGTRLGTDPEAVHDMRVAIRRLRAAVRTFGSGMSTALRSYLEVELPWLGQLLGAVRDFDVQLDHVARYAAAALPSHRAALTSFRDYMQAERARCREAMLAGLDSQRYFRLLRRMEQLAFGRPPVRPRNAAARETIAHVGRRALKKTFRRLLERGDRIHTAPTPEDLHQLRIRAKRLRYTLEFLRDITGKPGARFIKRLVKLQDLLGAYHDAVVAAELVRRYVEGAGAPPSPSTMLALGALVSSELHVAEQATAKWARTWRRFTVKRAHKELEVIRHDLRAPVGAGVQPTRAPAKQTAS
jgi:inorganic triphosphatase YgiF